MTVVPLREEDPRDAEIRLLKEQLQVVAACRWFDRFHALDGLRNDSCPACGGPITVEERQSEPGQAPGVVLKAARNERVEWLTEGLEEALKHLNEGRKSLAINAIKGTLAGKQACW